jgi:hypothetical protein
VGNHIDTLWAGNCLLIYRQAPVDCLPEGMTLIDTSVARGRFYLRYSIW